jgi:16S rRNA (guanine1207-N2)-methyltransferase
MESTSQVILRNESRLQPGRVLLVNPPRDSLFLQLQTDERPLQVSTQDYGDYCWLSANGASVSFDVIPQPDVPSRTIIMNLPREKERLVMMLHAISSWMPSDALLWLVGENNSGIKSSHRYLRQFFRNVVKLDSARHCVLYEAAEPIKEQPFHLKKYEKTWPLVFAGQQLEIVSLPGVFAHGRLDKGSQLLLKALDKLRPEGKILDFACGSGIIGSSLLVTAPSSSLTLLDVSALAFEASRKTLDLNGLTAALLPSDGLSELQGRYDWIISNPPFHRGVSNDLEIAKKFFSIAGTFLTENGRIVIVCNQHLPYESWLQNHFDRVERLEANDEFIVIQAGKPYKR